ncbi:MAG: hypothetical protein GXP27_05180 [Planctomycetes bacterium]|nr:hypothetical protein [Planctomycetota bacterium]
MTPDSAGRSDLSGKALAAAGFRTAMIATLLASLLLLSSDRLSAQPPKGSQLPLDENNCATCHGEEDLWTDEKARLFVSTEALAEDVHFRKGVNCHDCHGGDPSSFDVPEAHSTTVEADSKVRPFQHPLEKIWEACGKCHKEEAEGLRASAHAKAKVATENGRIDCRTCHGHKAHGLLPVKDARSPVFADRQVERCGHCHEKARDDYRASVHGYGLTAAGLVVTAVCADCHGAHAVFPAKDERSMVHGANVTRTCAKCHRFIAERLQKSVHGPQEKGKSPPQGKPEKSGQPERRPICTDCHQGHDLPHPASEAFRLRLPGRCGDCHEEASATYTLSLHGALTELGYGPAAKCSDCHGDHDILPISDAGSRLAPGPNRLQTCRKCHPNAVENFCDFDPHADHLDAETYPVLHAVYLFMELLIYSVFAFFGVHVLLWFVRSLAHVVRHGRPKRLQPGATAYLRFEPIHRVMHVIVIVSFLGLALTGLPLKYSSQPWAQELARSLGGFGSCSVWHHIFGVVTIGYFVSHLIWAINKLITCWRQGTPLKTLLLGPDSPVPNVRDFTDLYRTIRWFLGLGPKPGFDRWSYWEKFDYWAVFWGVAIMGSTGLILWYPNFFCQFLPGISLNVAKIVHSEEALLATSFIFAIHFFNSHLRPEKFPIDMVVLTGLVSEEELEEERPDFVRRMREAGKLEALKTTVPKRSTLFWIALGGFAALAVGLALLIGIIAAIIRF